MPSKEYYQVIQNLTDLRPPTSPSTTRDAAVSSANFKMELTLVLSTFSAGKVIYKTFPSVENKKDGFRCVLSISGQVASRSFAKTEEQAQQKAAEGALKAIADSTLRFSPKK